MKTHSKIPSPRSNVAATFRFLVVLIGIFPIMLWGQALIPIVWWWVRWMECWLQHQDFHKPCLRVKESQKNSMHTWHIVPCVFFSYVVFSCNNFNNEVFVLCGIIYPKTPHICGKDTKKTPRHQINLGYIKRYQKLFHFLFYRFIFFDTFNSVGMNNSTGHLSAFFIYN